MASSGEGFGVFTIISVVGFGSVEGVPPLCTMTVGVGARKPVGVGAGVSNEVEVGIGVSLRGGVLVSDELVVEERAGEGSTVIVREVVVGSILGIVSIAARPLASEV